MIREQRRDSILDATQELIDERGSTSFTMDEVANKAGVARVTIYRYFKNKRELLRAISEERHAEVEEGMLLETRERILDAASSVITEAGVRSATVHEIADAAGLGAATVYRHFGDRHGLMNAFVRERTPRRVLAGILHGKSSGDPRTDLEHYAQHAIELMSEKNELIQLVLSERSNKPEFMDVFIKAQGSSAEALMTYIQARMDAGEFRRVGTPKELAIAFLGMAFAFAWAAPQMGACEPNPAHQARLIVDMFLNGTGLAS